MCVCNMYIKKFRAWACLAPSYKRPQASPSHPKPQVQPRLWEILKLLMAEEVEIGCWTVQPESG